MVVSKVTMASGQWTMGAPTKVTVWAPKVKVSPSATVMQGWLSTSKPNWRISKKAFSVEMICTWG